MPNTTIRSRVLGKPLIPRFPSPLPSDTVLDCILDQNWKENGILHVLDVLKWKGQDIADCESSFRLALSSLVNGRTPADERNTVFGGEIRVCRNYHRRALRQRPCFLQLSKPQRRITMRLPSDIAFRTLRPFCKSHTIPTQRLPNSSAPLFRAPVHLTTPKYLSSLDLTMI